MAMKRLYRQIIAPLTAGMLFALATGCASIRARRDAAMTPPDPVPAVEEIDEALEQIQRLTQAIVLIRRNYIDDDKIDYQDLMHGALRGLLLDLDPYSQFLDPEAFRELRENAAGEFGGIGITIGMRNKVLTVIAPIEETPAFRAGILAGDKIVEIEGHKTDGMTLAEAVRKLRGEPGTEVSLRIMRDDSRELKSFKLVRDVIRVSSVRGERMLEEGIAYVRITKFSENTAENLQQALDPMLEEGLRALILDLRNNSGGLLASAVAVSQMFLPPGAPIVSTRGRGERVIGGTVRAAAERPVKDIPLAILINGGTASAAEIVAASLQDNRRAILVGEKSFGKGSVQSVLPIGHGQEVAIRLTTARYYTPSERVIHEQGIEPDIQVAMTPAMWRRVQLKRLREENPDLARDLEEDDEDLRDVTDLQLDRALDLLKALLIFHGKR